MGESSIQPAVAELERAYEHFNKELFEGKLTKPVIITIQTHGTRKGTLGWTRYLGWDRAEVEVDEFEGLKGSLKASETYVEVNIVAEALLHDPYGTLLHEMVHVWNHEQEIRDCSINGYHTKSFAEAAEKVGLLVTKHPTLGFANTAWDDKGREAMVSLKPNWDAFKIVRKSITMPTAAITGADGPGSRGKGGGPKKWSCPSCGVAVYSGRKELNVLCGDCDLPLEHA